MTSGTRDFSKSEQASEIIKELYLALFTQNALRNASSGLAGIYMDADISGENIQWEDTAACSLLQLLTKISKIRSEQRVCDARTLDAHSAFFQSKVIEFIELSQGPGALKLKWLPEILAKCQEFATKGCQPFIGCNDFRTYILYGLDELVAETCANMETGKLLSLKVHLAITRAFTSKAIELFTVQIQRIHLGPKAAGFSYFQSHQEFVPLLYVASTVYELVADDDIVSLENLYSYLAQIRWQFSVTDALGPEAEKKCNQLLELCLIDSYEAGKLVIVKSLASLNFAN
ncbi:hypothetical protein [Rhodoferax mekongensis]|uniref:Uncharacterized protein n=1 Tax=Rhodoferax mekongensis TaxID=3068341 RepID=A0ABZ0AWS4_9BURK|nr:hypothetical protein [Rhodoferax sp. TBRC 17307]WNO03955.1 hypothetical protein RAN89_13675 [Rhodoferax sp. TBRC 17307]